MLKDWLVSFALLFVLHYIMMLIIYGNNTFVEVIKRGFQAGDGMQQFQSYMQSMEDLKWNPSVNVPISQKFGSNVICLFMAGLTLAFIIMYLKRFIVVAFLMMIAPLITITYAIDKVRDKRSQALDTWRKEFFWTVLIQPFHCIIYLMFVPAALQLVANGDVGSSFMAIVFMTFILQAEDIVKNIFQIDNKDMGRLGASTALAVGGFMGSMKLAGSATKSVANTVNTGKNMNNANRVKVAATPTQASSGIKSTNKSTNTTEIAPASAKATAVASSNERGNGRGTTETQTNNIERKENSNGKGKLTTDAIMQQNEKFMESDKYRSSFERFANALTNSKALGFSGRIISGYTKAGLATALGALSLLENPSGGKLLGGAAVGYGLGSLTEKAVAGANNLTVRSLQKHVDDGRLRNRKDDFDNSYNEYIANGGTPESARKTVTKLMDADLNTINDDTKDITEIERKMAASAQRLFDQMKKMDYDEPLEEILQRTRRTKKA